MRQPTMALEYSAAMDALVYENVVVSDDAGPPPLQGEVWILGRRYSLPRGTAVWLLVHVAG